MVKDSDKYLSHWMEGTGPAAETVISSRVRLARNLKEFSFPYLSDDSDTLKVQSLVEDAVKKKVKEMDDFAIVKMDEVPFLIKQFMVEKHLVSPLLAKESRNSAVCLRQDEAVSIMINEEDHLRIQSVFPGLQLDKAWEEADRYDDLLEEHLDYSFHERYGYLSSCPTNVGTGMRASVMLHLPGLILTKQFNRILGPLSQVGLAFRGLYGEGTDIVGNLVQISNQITLGQSEEEIIRNLLSVTNQIIEQENRSCQALLNKNRDKIKDRALRALGLLKFAHLISSHEAMNLISELRLGFELGLVEGIERKLLNEMMILIRPAYLQIVSERELDENERDLERARQLRKRLQSVDIA